MTSSHLPITTARLVVRPLETRDLPAFAAYRDDPEVARYQSWAAFGMAQARALFERQRDLAFDTDETWVQLALERRTDGVLVGDVGVHFIDEGRQAEVGFTLARSCWGQGYAREAVGAVLGLLFDGLGKHRVVATVDARNGAAQRLLDGLGFRCEAHFVRNVFFKGAWGDELAYALLADERRAQV